MKQVKPKTKYTSPFNFLTKSKIKKETNEDWKSKYTQECYYKLLLIPHDDMYRALTDFEPISKLEWIASNVVSLYKQMEQLIGVLSEFCTCSQMRAGKNHVCMWTDDKGKKTKVSSLEYLNLYLTNAEKILSSQEIMPTQNGVDFHPNFIPTIHKIFRWMFQIIAHTYNCHFGSVINSQFVPSLNTIFLHLYIIVEQFQLFDEKEFEPLEELIEKWKSLIVMLEDVAVTDNTNGN